MKRLLIATLVALAGCGGLITPQDSTKADEYRAASPSRQGIKITVPTNGSQALTSSDLGSAQQALLGQTAASYTMTRSVTVVVNGAVLWVAALCEDIMTYPPTTMDDTHAVWGPWTDSLSPNTYMFTVTKGADGYDYVLQGKAKTDPDSAYLSLITGHHTPGATANTGNGEFTADWDACQKLPEHDQYTVGSGDFTYSRNDHQDVTVAVAFKQVDDGTHTGKLIDANYAFAQVAGGDGSFDFKTTDASANVLTFKSRWHNDGSGRADAKALLTAGTTGTESECWDSNFLETYLVESWDATALQGTPDKCVFADAEYSSL